jgi:ribulose-phosphate 3-epimerase
MSEIAPAILAENADSYKELAEKIHPFAHRVHVDITDGEFAPSFTVTEDQVWWPTEWVVDIHAMVARPSQHAQKLVSLRPNLIIFHAEVQEDLLQILNYVKQNGVKAGVALQRSTVPQTVAPLIEAADHVMIFSGELGTYGGVASLMQLEKIRLIKAINQGVEIGWDGGITMDNAFTLSQGGVNVLNVGGTIAKSADPAATYNALVNEINKQGII